MEGLQRTPRPEPRGQLHLSWLLQLRWFAFGGQLITVLVVRFGLGLDLPLGPLLAILAAFAASNLVLGVWFRRGGGVSGTAQGEHAAGSVFVGDLLILTALLYLTGGPRNPFGFFYVVNVTLAAVLLRPAWAWALALLAALAFGLLQAFHLPLGDDLSPRTHALGLFVAGALTVGTLVYFVTRVTRERDRSEAELDRQRELALRGERLQALATLTAGAAHELGSPLATIAVAAKELERSLDGGSASPEDAADARLIRDEVSRCRRILDRMKVARRLDDATELGSVGELLEAVRGELADASRVDPVAAPEVARLPLAVRGENLVLALRGLVQNALDASPAASRVMLVARREGPELVVAISDHGAGMDEETRRRALDPFFTTKEPGAGMGLGLFLAHSVVERLGGSLEIESTAGLGTHVTVTLPLETLGPASGPGSPGLPSGGP